MKIKTLGHTLLSFMGLVTWMKPHLVKREPNIHMLICEENTLFTNLF